jgi:hypothetical protein
MPGRQSLGLSFLFLCVLEFRLTRNRSVLSNLQFRR